MNVPGFIFAGGGTGGHLYPSLAVLERLRERTGDDVRAVFLCSSRAVDRSILEGEGVEFVPLPIATPAMRPVAMVRFIGSWGRSVRASRAAIRRLRDECGSVRVLSTGGFVSAPAVQAARAERCPVALLNLDTPPGKANRWLARHAGQVLNAGREARAGWASISPVVRKVALAPGDAVSCRRALGLDPARPTLLVTGASQGASSVNLFMAEFVRQHAGDLAGWQVLHQTGPKDSDAVREAYAQAGVSARVVDFINPMGVAWGAADLAVARAGAGTVAEAWANRVPTVFMPFPYHRDQHQRHNAEPLERAGAAVIAADLIEPSRNMTTAGIALAELLCDGGRRNAMLSALASLGPVDGAARVAEALLQS
ncbi:MAG TPA: UDP-N-acetylglucosamine--N-acetylmuramyl-(pentapeptide) pyrophosphoryl-undecaprenol N-acetylglucosamine transferase [Phycisphaerales bacterium]|nr:UDP-N-acetylglucosamine--N-acetylmuramyl-(pentapeptide) pyrophosphoryl-undecaprenol N-acetylglucosamine transferase [Phycisphaerales bacterium]